MNSSCATSLDRAVFRRARPLLGTFVEVRVGGLDAAAAAAGIEHAFVRVARVHALMTPHDDDSDVGRINRTAPGEAVRVHPWTWRVLAAAQRLSAATGGVFDVTLGGPGGTTHGGWRAVELRPGCRVRRRRAVQVDLGGIAKGFAVDVAAAALRAAGAKSGCVNAGGDLRVFGPAAEPVYVRHPGAREAGVLAGALCDAAFATSANYLDAPGAGRLQRPDGERLWIGRGSVSVVARTCMSADALTKVVAALGPEAAGPILRRYRATTVALTAGGEVVREVRCAA